MLLRIAEMSQRKAPNNLTIGKDASFPVFSTYNSSAPIHLLKDKIDLIPTIKDNGFNFDVSINGFQALELLDAGNYVIKNDKNLGYLSLNYDRSESKTLYLTESEIKKNIENQGITNCKISEITNGQSSTKIDLEKPLEYWKLFIVLALLFLIAELLLLKLWKN